MDAKLELGSGTPAFPGGQTAVFSPPLPRPTAAKLAYSGSAEPLASLVSLVRRVYGFAIGLGEPAPRVSFL